MHERPDGEPPVASPNGAGTRSLIVGLAGVAVVVVALVAGAFVLREVLAPEDKPAPAGTAANPTPADYDDLNEVVQQLQAYVERARGLTFKAPVKVEILKDDAFRAAYSAGDPADAVDLTGREATLRALGLLPDGVNLAEEEARVVDAVLGFYDPSTKELYVRGVGTTPYVRYVLVHELTHALQDQNFDLTRAAPDNDADLAQAAVIEGDAERTQRSYLSTLTSLEQDAIQREALAREDDLYNQAYYSSFDNFPYVVGVAFNDFVRGNKGQVALDDAFRTFPGSSAEIIHPERYLAGIGPAAVDAPAADGQIVDEGVVGEYDLIYLLAQAFDDADAFGIAQAWGGSRYVTWSTGKRSCTRVRFSMLLAEGDRVLAEALRVWGEGRDVRVEGAGPVTLTSCHTAA
jgi:hypothetical protein